MMTRAGFAAHVAVGGEEMTILLKRAYEAPSNEDGDRLLVERLWPRGLTKEKAAIDEWFKDIAPSQALRKWYAHDPGKWEEFRRRYRDELKRNAEEVERLRGRVKKGRVTFIYAARDEKRNSAVVLKEYLARTSPKA